MWLYAERDEIEVAIYYMKLKQGGQLYGPCATYCGLFLPSTADCFRQQVCEISTICRTRKGSKKIMGDKDDPDNCPVFQGRAKIYHNTSYCNQQFKNVEYASCIHTDTSADSNVKPQHHYFHKNTFVSPFLCWALYILQNVASTETSSPSIV